MSNAYIKNIIDKNGDFVYPQTRTDAIFTKGGRLLSTIAEYRPDIVNATMVASEWDAATKIYSFETTYPVAEYDIDLEIDGDNVTAEQYAAWSAAMVVGSTTTNSARALGAIPSIDIPVILKIKYKDAENAADTTTVSE